MSGLLFSDGPSEVRDRHSRTPLLQECRPDFTTNSGVSPRSPRPSWVTQTIGNKKSGEGSKRTLGPGRLEGRVWTEVGVPPLPEGLPTKVTFFGVNELLPLQGAVGRTFPQISRKIDRHRQTPVGSVEGRGPSGSERVMCPEREYHGTVTGSDDGVYRGVGTHPTHHRSHVDFMRQKRLSTLRSDNTFRFRLGSRRVATPGATPAFGVQRGMSQTG